MHVWRVGGKIVLLYRYAFPLALMHLPWSITQLHPDLTKQLSSDNCHIRLTLEAKQVEITNNASFEHCAAQDVPPYTRALLRSPLCG